MLMTLADYTQDSIIADKTAIEAGWVNNPADRGGETNHGITKALADRYKTQLHQMYGWDGTMRNLTVVMAHWIYVQVFWNPMQLDTIITIHPLIADALFDAGINMDTHPAVRFLQRYLNLMNKMGSMYPDIAEDGVMGPGTINTLRTYISLRGNVGINRLLIGFKCMQGSQYFNLSEHRPLNETFTYGWLGRVTDAVGHYARLLGIAV